MIYEEKILTSEKVYSGKIINLRRDTVRLQNGAEAGREVVEHSGGVGVLALDENGCVLMVRQYRHGTGKISLEIPAGKLNPGEDPGQCGARELEEETGFAPVGLTPFGSLDPTPAYCSEKIYLYLAKELKKGRQGLDEDEFLSAERVPFEKAAEMCLSGEITDAKTLVAVLKYKILLG